MPLVAAENRPKKHGSGEQEARKCETSQNEFLDVVSSGLLSIFLKSLRWFNVVVGRFRPLGRVTEPASTSHDAAQRERRHTRLLGKPQFKLDQRLQSLVQHLSPDLGSC